MNIKELVKQYSFLFILLLFTFLFVGLNLFLNTQDSSLNNNVNTIQTFTEKNIFFLILSVFVILIGFYIYNIIKFYNQNPVLRLKPSYEIDYIYDSPKKTLVKDTDIDCPQDERRFSFTFFINIENFYCNRNGYWKPILLKGTDINNTTFEKTFCSKINGIDKIKDIKEFNSDSIFAEFSLLNKTMAEALDTKYTMDSTNNMLVLTKKDKTNKITFQTFNTNRYATEKDNIIRVDLVCKILDDTDELMEAKKKLFKFIATRKKFINDSNLDEHTCELFLEKHKKYCYAAYAINKKIRPPGDPKTLKIPADDSLLNDKDKLFYDDYDNKCSLTRLSKDFDYLLPKNFELNSRIELINLAKKNNMDTFNPNPDNEGIEGYYYIPESELFLQHDSSSPTYGFKINGNKFIYTADIKNIPKLVYYKDNLLDTSMTLGKDSNNFGFVYFTDKYEAITYCIENGFEYIIIMINNSTSMITDSKKIYGSLNSGTVAEPQDLDDYLKKVSPTNAQYCVLNSSKIDILDNRYKKQPGNADNHYLVKIEKVKQNKEQIILDRCWKKITHEYPTQSPGVWFHPFINNIRVCVTTHSDTNYTEVVNDTIEAYKFTDKNYYIEQIHNFEQKDTKNLKHAEVENKVDDISFQEEKTCSPKNDSSVNKKFHYMEYIDIENIPIKEEFHFAVVLNDSLLEIYINGKLRESIKLFGSVKYSNGNLQLNAGSNINLGGYINFFKYFPYSLKGNQINNIINERNSLVKNEPINSESHEHAHNVEIAHQHEYDTDTHAGHKHSIDDEDINHEYYIE